MIHLAFLFSDECLDAEEKNINLCRDYSQSMQTILEDGILLVEVEGTCVNREGSYECRCNIGYENKDLTSRTAHRS